MVLRSLRALVRGRQRPPREPVRAPGQFRWMIKYTIYFCLNIAVCVNQGLNILKRLRASFSQNLRGKAKKKKPPAAYNKYLHVVTIMSCLVAGSSPASAKFDIMFDNRCLYNVYRAMSSKSLFDSFSKLKTETIFFNPVLMLWCGIHIDSHVWR